MNKYQKLLQPNLSNYSLHCIGATDDLKMAGAEAWFYLAIFSQVTNINDSCRKLQGLESDIQKRP